MKKFLPLFLISLLIQGSLEAQDMLGYRNSNYSGIQGLGINPASIHTSRLDIDVNIIGLSATIENDFIYLPKEELKFFGIGNILNKFNDKEYLDEFTFSKANDTYNASVALSIMGPGVMFNIKNKHSFAITSQWRTAVSANDVQGSIGKYAVEGLGYDPLHNNVFDAKDFQLNILSWLEYGLSYATTLTENEQGSLTGGVTLKLLNGLAGAYAENANIQYNVLNDSDMVFLPGSSIDYGRTDYNSFDNLNSYGDMINGTGFGFDIGFTYDFLKDPASWQYEMDGKKQSDPTLNRYKLRLGLSLLDFGKINFKDNAGTYHLETADEAYYRNYDTDNFDDNIDFDKTMSAIFYDNDSLASFRKADFKMNLPAALSLQVDWNAYKKFYVNASYIYGLESKKPGVDRASVVALTPRYETPWFDVSVPISYYNYTGQISRVGLSMRFASFFIGSDRVGTLFGLGDLNGMDVYAGLKFSMNKERIRDYDGDRVSDAKDKCREIAGILKFEGCPDRDGDDVPDAIDQCPDTKGLVALAGCPDGDGDGIIDGKDECPTTKGLHQFNGCPDTDSDGIKDSEDECPSIPGLALYKGCPDTDGDSIPDPQDDCPTNKGLPEYKGCPDSDGDGLPDNKDDCPFDVGPISNKGCPVKITQAPAVAVPAKLTEEEQEVINKVFSNLQFETGKAVIKETSYSSLDALALLMNKKPSFKLNIDGHTDNTGSAAMNKTLSQKRADAAKTYLGNKGVDISRIQTKGYGKDKPVSTNATAEGRAKNRRVEFLLFE
ncbi:MAG: OmpA family protein [Bacteroidetes bacterium]|nr:OmpA family protein [Bacteroidota bacterium]